MPRNLCSLPAEILHQICETLDELDPSSVLSYALACRKCHAVARAQLLRTITFDITNCRLIWRQVRECEDFLDSLGEDSFLQVRRVVITGSCEYEDEAPDHLQHPPLPPTQKGDERHWNLHTPPPTLWQASYDKLHHYLPVRNGYMHRFEARRIQVRPAPEPSKMREVWAPLMNLLDRFPGLAHLEFNCIGPLPPSILLALENGKPRPRLSLGELKLRYEVDTESGRLAIARYDLAVITSLCLYRLCFAPEEIRSDPRNPGLNDIAGTLLRCGVAPNLQEIKFATEIVIPDDEEQEHEEEHDDEESNKFRDFLPEPWRFERMHRRDLKSLEICSEDTMSSLWRSERIRKSTLQTMGLAAHCMALRTLKLSQPVGLDAVLSLMDWVPACLSHLSFSCEPKPFWGGVGNQQYLKQVKKFIRNQHKLASVEIIGWDHLTEPFVSGEPLPPNLHTLLFTPCAVLAFHRCIISVEEIECIAEFCPHIQDLSLILGRAMGNATEVAQYQAIGRFRELRNLTLTLDSPRSTRGFGYRGYQAVPFPFSKLDPRDQSWRHRHSIDLIDLNHRNSRPEKGCGGSFLRIGTIYEHMVNHALDEKLGGSIFETISRSQGKFHGGDKTQSSASFGSLERMLVRTTGNQSFQHGAAERFSRAIRPFALGLSRSFYIKVDKLSTSESPSGPRKAMKDDQKLHLIIREVGNKSDDRQNMSDVWKRLVNIGSGELLSYFGRIWSSTGDGKHSTRGWWEDWDSFPLQLEE